MAGRNNGMPETGWYGNRMLWPYAPTGTRSYDDDDDDDAFRVPPNGAEFCTLKSLSFFHIN